MNGAHRRAAKTVDRHTGHDIAEARQKADDARDIVALLGFRIGAAKHEVLDQVRREASAPEQFLDYRAGQIVGPGFGERAFAGKVEWRTGKTRDYDVGHLCLQLYGARSDPVLGSRLARHAAQAEQAHYQFTVLILEVDAGPDGPAPGLLGQ